MILVQKGLIYHPVKKSAVHIEMHTQLGLATRVSRTRHARAVKRGGYQIMLCRVKPHSFFISECGE